MVIVRDAKFDDFDELIPMFRSLFSRSDFSKSGQFDLTHARRMFTVATATPNFFCQVVERNGRIVGCMGGVITDTFWGDSIATDVLMLSEVASDRLIRNFKAWAKRRGAVAVQITNLYGSDRYDKLLNRLGVPSSGQVHLEIF